MAKERIKIQHMWVPDSEKTTSRLGIYAVIAPVNGYKPPAGRALPRRCVNGTKRLLLKAKTRGGRNSTEALEEVAEGWRTPQHARLDYKVHTQLRPCQVLVCGGVPVQVHALSLQVPLEHFRCPLTICMAVKRSGDFKTYLTLEITPMEQIFTI